MAYHGSNTKNAIFYNFLIGQNHPSDPKFLPLAISKHPQLPQKAPFWKAWPHHSQLTMLPVFEGRGGAGEEADSADSPAARSNSKALLKGSESVWTWCRVGVHTGCVVGCFFLIMKKRAEVELTKKFTRNLRQSTRDGSEDSICGSKHVWAG